MIPRGAVTEWQARVLWPQPYQVEQDLILTRLMIEIARYDLLGGEFVLRGGTCLHKLHLSEPLRYSEDLDYVRRTHSGVGPYLDALRDIAADIGLKVSSVQRSGQMAHVLSRLNPPSHRDESESRSRQTSPRRPLSAPPSRDRCALTRSGSAEKQTFRPISLKS